MKHKGLCQNKQIFHNRDKKIAIPTVGLNEMNLNNLRQKNLITTFRMDTNIPGRRIPLGYQRSGALHLSFSGICSLSTNTAVLCTL
jgi:hypothetical protein